MATQEARRALVSGDDWSELRPAYRTLNEPSRLLGLSLAGWATVLVAGALGYAWLTFSPLGWRANVSGVVVGLGAPAALLVLRESTTVSPGGLLVAVFRWRLRSAELWGTSPARAGAVRLDCRPIDADDTPLEPELPWTADGGGEA
jgi:hypothetical protein